MAVSHTLFSKNAPSLMFDKELFTLLEIKKAIIQLWRPNNGCKYESYSRKYKQLCSESIYDLECSTLVKDLEFLYSFQKEKLGCGVSNSVRGILSLFATTEKYDASKHRLISWYMKALYNINPCLQKCSFI